jgi:hypothetical protein
MYGGFDTFLFTDPDDNAVAAQTFGVGDGDQDAFQLVRTLGSFTEPVYDLNGAPSIYKAACCRRAATRSAAPASSRSPARRRRRGADLDGLLLLALRVR